MASATTFGAFAAKTHLAELLVRAEAGESITITKHGRPVARLVPVGESPVNRDWADFWARADERRSRMGGDGLAFSQEQIEHEISEGRM